MPSSFPGALDNIPSNKANGMVMLSDHPSHHNLLADAVNAVQKGGVGVYSVRQFGAEGDGSTDDTAAIRLAIAAACAAGGGTVLFPGGAGTVYLLGPSSATYSLTLCSSLTLAGDGAVLRRKAGNTETLVGAAAALSDVVVRGLTIDNQSFAVDPSCLRLPNGSARIALERVRVMGLYYSGGVTLATGPVQSSDVRIADCSFERTAANRPTYADENTVTVQLYDCSRLRVERCRFDGIGGLYLVAANATACPTSNPMRHVALVGCTFERIKSTSVFAFPAITGAAMANVDIVGNTFLNIGKEIEKGAIAVQPVVGATMAGVTVRGNTIRDWGASTTSPFVGTGGGYIANAASAIDVSTPGGTLAGVVVEGNVLDGRTAAGTAPANQNSGIVVCATDVVVRGNTIRSCGLAGVRVEGSAASPVARFVVDGNEITRCGLFNDASLRTGAITVVDYATAGSITNNLCTDHGPGAGPTSQDAGIALRTGASPTTIADIKIAGNHCYDTRAPGSKTQYFGIRVGDTGSADSAQPTRITLQGNDVGGVNVDGGNITSGLYFQRTVDLGYVVADNAGFAEAIAQVASANDLVLPHRQDQGGHFTYRVTGTTQINHIASTNWRPGSIVTLIFTTSTVTVKYGQASSGVNRVLILVGTADFLATSFDTLTLVYEQGTTDGWYEIARSVNG